MKGACSLMSRGVVLSVTISEHSSNLLLALEDVMDPK
jgi:hypothetical protein